VSAFFADWNCRVHSVILDLALDNEDNLEVDWLNWLDTAMMNAMRAIAAHHPLDTASVNHTYHAPLRTKPVSVNIETKLTGQHWNSAVVQLGIWMAARFKKLGQIVAEANGDLASLPFLPAIVIQGHY